MSKLSLSLKLMAVGTNFRQRIQRKWISLASDTLNLLLLDGLTLACDLKILPRNSPAKIKLL